MISKSMVAAIVFMALCMSTAHAEVDLSGLQDKERRTNPAHKRYRIALGKMIWQQENALELWAQAAVFYGGFAELTKQYTKDSNVTPLDCAINHQNEPAQKLFARFAYPKL